MKIIPKFLSGGDFNRFSNRFATYTSNIRQTSLQTRPQQVSRVSSRKDDDEESTKGKLTEKDLFTMIEKINALPNERRAIISSLKEMLDDGYLMDADSSDIRMMYLTALDTISQAKYNSDTFTKIKESLSTKDAFSDPAITTDGKVMVINSDGELGTVTATEYLENNEDYLILTNSDLATMREYSSSFINDYKSFSTLQNAVSTKTFQEYIDAAEKDLKTMEYTREGLFSIENGKVAKGLEVLRNLQLNDLVQAMGSITADGLYEYKIIDKDDKQSLLALTAYIVSTMPSNIRTWAALKTGIGDEGLKTLVETYLISQSSPSHEFQIDYKGSMEKVSKGEKSEDDSTDKLKLNAAGQFYLGYGDDALFVVNPGTQYNFVVLATTKSLTDKSGNSLGAMCLLQEVTTGEYSEMLDYNNAVMGNIKIPISSFNHIVIEDGQIYSIDMPLTKDGKPNMTPEAKINREAAMKELKENNIDINSQESVNANINKINSIMEKHQLPQMYNNQGKLIAGNWGRFAVMNGLAFGEALGVDEVGSSSLLLEEIDEVITTGVKDVIETKLKSKYRVDPLDSNIEWGYDELYRGTIWIPIKDNFFNTLNKDITVKQSLEIAKLEHLKKILQSYNKGAWN